MNQHPQPRETPAPILTAGDARKLAENLMDVMNALLGIIERETELVRAGKVAAAMALEPDKTDLSRPLRRRRGASESQPAISVANRAGAAGDAASSSRRVSRHAADQPDGARDGACGVRKHRARRQCRNSTPQYSQHLYRGGTARDAGPAPHDAARRQPIALTGFGFEACGHFSSNLRAGFSTAFIAFSNKTLTAAGHSC